MKQLAHYPLSQPEVHMWLSYLTIALRNLYRNRSYSFINIAGFSIGLVVSMIIGFYVVDDLTYDRFHENCAQIHRLLTIENSGDETAITYAITSGPLVLAANAEVPEVVASTRIFTQGGVPLDLSQLDESGAREGIINARILLTDPGFFEVFTFPILSGDGPEKLAEPGAIFITPELAATVFGDKDPVGRQLNLPQLPNAHIAGIVTKPPQNSHIQFDALVSLQVDQNPVWWDSWENLMLSGYVRLNEQADPKITIQKITDMARQHDFAEVYLPDLQPLKDVHLGSGHHRYDFYNMGKNEASVVYSLIVIGIMVLLIAVINFINLATARASSRAREVGLRKVSGSNRQRLVLQFLSESTLLTLLAMTIAVLLFELTLPYINQFIGKNLQFNLFSNPLLFVVLLGLTLLIGALSGIYPAIMLSRFQPADVLRGRFRTSRTGILLRQTLVVFQFTATIALITSVLIVLQQIRHIQSVDIGYNRDQVMVIPNQRTAEEDILRTRLASLPGIQTLGRTSNAPGPNFLRIEAIPEGADRVDSRMFQQMAVDEDFFSTMEIDILDGRGFSRDFPSDLQEGVLINETAVAYSGWDSALGRRLDFIQADGTTNTRRVVGIVNDFHYLPARLTMEPMAFILAPQQSALLLARLGAETIQETVAQVEVIYRELYPDRDFNFFFMDDVFNRQFQGDRVFATNMAVFSGLAILIACLGLLGLVIFAVGQRRREIAVRKVLGCTPLRILGMLARDFLKWVLLANLFAWPLAFWGMRIWLNGFIYKMALSPWPFLLAGLTVLIIAFLTMGVQALSAALSNPIENLKYE